MIKIEVLQPSHAKWTLWRKACDDEQKELVKNNKRKIDKDLYKGKKKAHQVQETFFFARNIAPFFGKCVYCEEIIYRGQHGDVEHFRPKGAVDDINFKRIQIGKGKSRRNHPGYYWLVYEWKNLVPACTLCNSVSTKHSKGEKIGKWNRFPVVGKHAIEPGKESLEKPLLINPASDKAADDPLVHMKVDPTGVLLDLSQRGKTCIDVFGLNFRDLPDARKGVFDEARNYAVSYLKAIEVAPNGEEKQALEKKIKDIMDGKSEYSAAGRAGLKAGFQNAGATSARFLVGL